MEEKKFDFNSIIGFVLIFGILIWIMYQNQPSEKEIAAEKAKKELVAKQALNAGTVIRELGKYIDGNGGGQPFFASGKGKNVGGIREALEKAVEFIK